MERIACWMAYIHCTREHVTSSHRWDTQNGTQWVPRLEFKNELHTITGKCAHQANNGHCCMSKGVYKYHRSNCRVMEIRVAARKTFYRLEVVVASFKETSHSVLDWHMTKNTLNVVGKSAWVNGNKTLTLNEQNATNRVRAIIESMDRVLYPHDLCAS